MTQAKGQRSWRNIFFDTFRFVDGLIVEHWARLKPHRQMRADTLK